jgi:hypothetical protein
MVRAAIVLSLSVAVASCEYESGGAAAGLTAKSLPQVQLGMTRAELLRVLGPPLSESAGSAAHATRWLTYARPRRLSVGGDYEAWQPAQECAVVLKDDVVSAAYYSDPSAGVRCWCRPGACSTEWAAACLRTLR